MTETLPQILWEHRDRLPMFTVYDHPRDQPDVYVARLWLTLPKAEPTNLILSHPEIEAIRAELRGLGLTRLMRRPEDDPKIMETWL